MYLLHLSKNTWINYSYGLIMKTTAYAWEIVKQCM